MNQDQLMDVIRKGESETVEFKENFDKESVETAGAFANAKGGIILIGVSDKSRISSVKIGKETLNSWANRIAQSTDPRVIPDIEIGKIGGKSVVTIWIKEFPIKPVSVKGRCYRRVGTSNRMMTPIDIAEMHMHSVGESWDAFPAKDKTIEDIDLDKVETYIQYANSTGRRKIDDKSLDVLKKLEFVKNGKITWAVLLIFGKEPQRPLLQSAVHCGRFKLDKTQIIDDLMVETSLIEQVDEVMKFITRHISVRYEFEGKPRRREVWEYPLDALREAVINAIAHRDYAISANVQVEIYDDRIEIWNPGELPEPLKPKDLKGEHKSIPRNQLLADTLFLIRFIEEWGRGTNRIVDEMQENKLPDPTFKELSGGFEVVLMGPGKSFEDAIIKEKLHVLDINERQKKAIKYVNEKLSITRREYMKINNVSHTTAQKELKELVIKKVFRTRGTGKYIYYELTQG